MLQLPSKAVKHRHVEGFHPMLPDHEVDTLTIAVTDAVDLAPEGKLADGYSALAARLKWAEAIAADGVPLPGEE
jgi:hypothetical protein